MIKKRYINKARLKEYKAWKACNLFGIAEHPLLSWDFYIHHSEDEIRIAEAEKRQEILEMLDD